MRILVIGSLVWDSIAGPVDQLAWDTTQWVDHLGAGIGGNGASTAYTIAKLGGQVGLLSACGDDPAGDVLLSTLAAVGVDCGPVQRLPGPTAMTVGLFAPDGRRQLWHAPGVNRDAHFALPTGWDHLHIANPFALPGLRQTSPALLEAARAQGLTTSLDLGWDRLNEWDMRIRPCLPFTDLLFGNADEMARIPGPYPCPAIVKQGADGSTLNGHLIPGFAVPTIDTTGAGDCFCGAFLAARAQGYPDPAAARLANAVAALSTTHPGATPGLLSWSETLAWLHHRP